METWKKEKDLFLTAQDTKKKGICSSHNGPVIPTLSGSALDLFKEFLILAF